MCSLGVLPQKRVSFFASATEAVIRWAQQHQAMLQVGDTIQSFLFNSICWQFLLLMSTCRDASLKNLAGDRLTANTLILGQLRPHHQTD